MRGQCVAAGSMPWVRADANRMRSIVSSRHSIALELILPESVWCPSSMVARRKVPFSKEQYGGTPCGLLRGGRRGACAHRCA